MPPPGTGAGTGAAFDPVTIVHALETNLNPGFQKNRIEIVDGDLTYIVRDLSDGFFNATLINGRGGSPVTGTAPKMLPCDSRYLGLVLNAWSAVMRN